MTRRSTTAAFAPDAFVFPGGTIEPQDGSPASHARTLGLDPERLDREFRASIPGELACAEPAVGRDAAGALLVAALRELFEEAGVLFARTAQGTPIDAGSAHWKSVAAQRSAVRSGALPFSDFLTSRDWYADARALTLFSHWITPPSEPRRYNTHFFFAVAPSDQAALADASETHDGIWISPAMALERRRAGTLHLVYPTVKHLERLQAFPSLEAALEFARRKPVLTIVPNDTAGDFEIPAALENAW